MRKYDNGGDSYSQRKKKKEKRYKKGGPMRTQEDKNENGNEK